MVPLSMNVESLDELLRGNGQVHSRHNALTSWKLCGTDCRVAQRSFGTLIEREVRRAKSAVYRRDAIEMMAQNKRRDSS